MMFVSSSTPQEEISVLSQTERDAVGCEAWIDLGRFRGEETFVQQPADNHQAIESPLHSAIDCNTLAQSCTLMFRKLRHGFASSLG